MDTGNRGHRGRGDEELQRDRKREKKPKRKRRRNPARARLCLSLIRPEFSSRRSSIHLIDRALQSEKRRKGEGRNEGKEEIKNTGMLKNTLNDPTAVRMRSELEDFVRERLDDKLRKMNLLDDFLDDVISVLIFDALQNMPVQLLHQSSLLLRLNELQCLLNDAAAVHLQRESQNMSFQRFSENSSLLASAVLEKLLNDVVSEDVSHQGEGMREDLLMMRMDEGSRKKGKGG